MKTIPFFTCLSYYGINTGTTGSVVGAYDFSSGSGNALVYNLVYPTGQNFSGSNYYAPSQPLAQVGVTGITGNLSGRGSYRLGYEVSGDFGLVIDTLYDICSRSSATGSGYAYSLISNTSGSPTGFLIGIDEANHLFVSSSGCMLLR